MTLVSSMVILSTFPQSLTTSLQVESSTDICRYVEDAVRDIAGAIKIVRKDVSIWDFGGGMLFHGYLKINSAEMTASV